MRSCGRIVVVPAALCGARVTGAAEAAVRPELRAALPAANPWPPPQTSVSWSDAAAAGRPTVHLQLLGFNDFHGNLQSPSVSSARQVGGAAALAGYLKALERAAPARTLIVHAGDQLGAGPPINSLLQNEPAIEFLNLLANRYCHYGDALQFFDARNWRRAPNRCNVVGTLGNHEFDAGPDERRRLLGGGNASDGPFLENPYRGSRVPYICANVMIDRRQWPSESNALPRILKTAGLYYSWDPERPAGARIVEACDAAYQPLNPARHYRVTVNDFLANGGDGFTTCKTFGPGESGPLDSDALERYLKNQGSAVPSTKTRIARTDFSSSRLCAAP